MNGTSGGPGPESIAILRLSAIGDVVQVVPTVRLLQERFPRASITWIVGRRELELVGDLDGVEFVTLRKDGVLSPARALARWTRERRFDVLLHMHPSFRANVISLAVPAPVRVGYDRDRSRDLHGLFVNRRIPPERGQHVLESFLSFARLLGARPGPARWGIPVGEEPRAFARAHLPDGRRHLVISPCSSHPRRDWHPEGYAAVAAHAMDRHGMDVVLCGGPTQREREMGRAIETALGRPVTNVIGRDTLKKLLAVLERATVLVSPDSGPAHMASAVGTPVVGLHAATDPARSGPYGSLRWCVNRFDAAAHRFRNRPAGELPWRSRIEEPGVMDLIEPAAVTARLDALMEYLDGKDGGDGDRAEDRQGAAPPEPEASSARTPRR